MAKNRYIEDYEIEVSINDKGREKKTLKYRGPYFDISLTGLTYQTYKRISFLLFAGLVIFHVSSGFAVNQGMYQFYVALPYASTFLPLTFLGFSLFRLPKKHLKIQRDEMEQSFKRIKITSTIVLVLLAIVISGETIYFIAYSANAQLLPEFLFLFPELISVLIVFGLFRLQKKIYIHISEE
jgi:amino acid transporter